MSHRAAIKKAVSLDARVKYALQRSNMSALLQPRRTSSPRITETVPPLEVLDVEVTHILEWREFLAAAEGLFRRESDRGQHASSITMRHEIDNRTYYIKLFAQQGQLRGAQTLCDNNGRWQAQLFRIDPEQLDNEDDETGLNMIMPLWDKAEILATLHEGEPIQNRIYEGYRASAAKSLQKELQERPRLVPAETLPKLHPIKAHPRKRPAA